MEALKGLSDDKIKRIILEVQENRFLWDKDAIYYRNSALKELTWTRIAETVELPEERVKKVWSTLRDTRTRYKREVKKSDPGGPPPKRAKIASWKWAEALEFLSTNKDTKSIVDNTPHSPVIQLSDTEDEIYDSGDTTTTARAHDTSNGVGEARARVSNTSETQEASSGNTMLRSKKSSGTRTNDDHENLYIPYSMRTQGEYGDKDEEADRQWLLSLLPNFRGMPLRNKNLLKYKIQGLFLEVDNEEG